MRVLVTGGAGFIGSHLVDRFLQDGYEVRVLDNLEPKVHPDRRVPLYLPKEVEFLQGEVTDRDLLMRALQGVDVVSHQAAYQDYMPDFSRFVQVNAVSTALIFELVVQHRMPVRKIIIASSQAVYGEGQYRCASHGFFLPVPRSQEQLQARQWDVRCPACHRTAEPVMLDEGHWNPYNQYAVSKIAEERIALGLGWLHNIPAVALRYSITQGARQSLFNHYSGVCRIFFSRALRRQPLIIYEDGGQTRDFVHVQDVVDANMLVLEKDEANYQAFNVGSGRRTTVLEYAKSVAGHVGLGTQCEISGQYRRGDNRHSVSAVEKLRQLGWQPSRGLDVIFRDFLNWIDSIGGVPEHIPDAYAAMQSAGVVVAAGS
jgi:dTDP-L-rhamnose 4-epimerase